jgi:hypothetical protein
MKKMYHIGCLICNDTMRKILLLQIRLDEHHKFLLDEVCHKENVTASEKVRELIQLHFQSLNQENSNNLKKNMKKHTPQWNPNEKQRKLTTGEMYSGPGGIGLALKESKLPKNRIIGMGGALDSARFNCYLSQALNAPASDVQGVVIGGHGDTTMIPLTRLATHNGVPVSQTLDAETLKKIAADTMVGGATLTGMLGTSAWYAPGAAVATIVDSILNDQKKLKHQNQKFQLLPLKVCVRIDILFLVFLYSFHNTLL